jgi:hypothetical protein
MVKVYNCILRPVPYHHKKASLFLLHSILYECGDPRVTGGSVSRFSDPIALGAPYTAFRGILKNSTRKSDSQQLQELPQKMSQEVQSVGAKIQKFGVANCFLPGGEETFFFFFFFLIGSEWGGGENS